MSDETAGWMHCDSCGEDWPAEAFKSSGSAYHGKIGRRVCGACYEDLYPRRVVPCSVCGKRMSTRGYTANPTHRKCRAAVAA